MEVQVQAAWDQPQHVVDSCMHATATQLLQCPPAHQPGLAEGPGVATAAPSWGQCRGNPSMLSMLRGHGMLEDAHLRDAGRLLKAQPVRDVHDEALRGHCLLCIATAVEQGHHLQACWTVTPLRPSSFACTSPGVHVRAAVCCQPVADARTCAMFRLIALHVKLKQHSLHTKSYFCSSNLLLVLPSSISASYRRMHGNAKNTQQQQVADAANGDTPAHWMHEHKPCPVLQEMHPEQGLSVFIGVCGHPIHRCVLSGLCSFTTNHRTASYPSCGRVQLKAV